MSVDLNIKYEGVSRARDDFFELIRDDYTQFGFLPVLLRKYAPELTPDGVHQASRVIVSDLFQTEGIYDVDLTSELPSGKTLPEILEAIDTTFRLSSDAPDISDGPWFGID